LQEAPMHVRVTQLRILTGKVEEFSRAVDSLIPAIHRQSGYRGLIVLHSGEEDKPEATAISMWESLAHLRASESNMFYYEALRRLFECCEGYPIMHEEEVLVSDFVQARSQQAL
jgi:heme-degrading monooxygenase HmoA